MAKEQSTVERTSDPISLAAYKKANKLSKIVVCKARKSGNYYAVDENGEYLFQIADGIDPETVDKKQLMIADYKDTETGEEWSFCFIPGRDEVAEW